MKGTIVARPGRRLRLRDVDPDDARGIDTPEEAKERLARDLERMRKLQRLLYADGRFALLVVLQAMDTGGKDGTIRHVMSGLNPAGCTVTSFKVPSAEEQAHDFLWRIHHAVPARGMIGVFNRSHYEDVLVVRVHDLVPEDVWKARYRQINAFERHLSQNNVTILKFYLHISKEEQAERLRARIADPAKNWKFSPADLEERKLWKKYMAAFDDAINECSTPWAPWHVVPANKKWARDAMIARAMVKALESLPLRPPKSKVDLSKIVIR
ncbi:MAG TPA: polyphosphate kinase 2 family protein [Candidatus Eisenbacteria bacterium]|nr:polyphosphate kinase 2 family protein [Candidatus Eisenbacteria bacterium]